MSKAIVTAFGTTLGAATIAATAFIAGPQAATRVEVGVLTCTAASSTGFIVGSTRELRCRFNRSGRDEFYTGTIQKFGLDIGSTQKTQIAWAVLAPTAHLPPRSLVGSYGGVSAEATVGVGLGANALIGGSSRSIVLQPLSVQSQQGLNIAAGVAALQLRPAR
jgi:putative Ca2+/H+ antiporter (TMEM165/GDT1 family)